ncbi:hypothetical protein CMUS01_07053 [Colletotrichum musicola]|uniref:Uncharacterized protein n=1 Tax=Colletotrichum musicola TaxID=2175873 RepID=A0A8H6KIJ5_9PEZI|nr:hypothetical protein CMUS01_07053 [Colletotrichum musicola]
MSPAPSDIPEQSRRSGGTQLDNILGIFNPSPSADATNVRIAEPPSTPTEEEDPNAVSLPEGSQRVAPPDDKGWATAGSKRNKKAKQHLDDSQSITSEDTEISTAIPPRSQATHFNSYSNQPSDKNVVYLRDRRIITGFQQTRIFNQVSPTEHRHVGHVKWSKVDIYGKRRYIWIRSRNDDDTLYQAYAFYTHDGHGPPEDRRGEYMPTYSGAMASVPPPGLLAFVDNHGRQTRLPKRCWLRCTEYLLLKEDEFVDPRQGVVFMIPASQSGTNSKIKTFTFTKTFY